MVTKKPASPLAFQIPKPHPMQVHHIPDLMFAQTKYLSDHLTVLPLVVQFFDLAERSHRVTDVPLSQLQFFVNQTMN
jgi:hypothetical protein